LTTNLASQGQDSIPFLEDLCMLPHRDMFDDITKPDLGTLAIQQGDRAKIGYDLHMGPINDIQMDPLVQRELLPTRFTGTDVKL